MLDKPGSIHVPCSNHQIPVFIGIPPETVLTDIPCFLMISCFSWYSVGSWPRDHPLGWSVARWSLSLSHYGQSLAYACLSNKSQRQAASCHPIPILLRYIQGTSANILSMLNLLLGFETILILHGTNFLAKYFLGLLICIYASEKNNIPWPRQWFLSPSLQSLAPVVWKGKRYRDSPAIYRRYCLWKGIYKIAFWGKVNSFYRIPWTNILLNCMKIRSMETVTLPSAEKTEEKNYFVRLQNCAT